jgi:DNA-binding FadR family transcriptional regulator
VIDKMRVSRTPIPGGDRDTGSGRAGRDQALSRISRTHFSRSETADLYEPFKRLEYFAVELAVWRMSGHDIERFENILIKAPDALQRADTRTHAIRDRGVFENVAEQSENSRSSRRWHGLHCKSSFVARSQA